MGSLRNNVGSALVEIKPDVAARGLKPEYADFTTVNGFVNYLQKVAIGVGADYLTGQAKLKLTRVRGGYASAAVRTKDVHMRWLYEHNVKLLLVMDRAFEASKSVGEGLSNIIEDALKDDATNNDKARPSR